MFHIQFEEQIECHEIRKRNKNSFFRRRCPWRPRHRFLSFVLCSQRKQTCFTHVTAEICLRSQTRNYDNLVRNIIISWTQPSLIESRIFQAAVYRIANQLENLYDFVKQTFHANFSKKSRTLLNLGRDHTHPPPLSVVPRDPIVLRYSQHPGSLNSIDFSDVINVKYTHANVLDSILG